jgi:integrase
MRHQVFYFRWRVQAELQAALGLKEIRVSLGTSSLLVAKSRANQWFDFVNHAKLMKNAYQFSEISRNDYIQSMKNKIVKIQSNANHDDDSAYSTELIRVTHASGMVFEVDYDGDAEKEIQAAQKLIQTEVTEKKKAGITLSQFFEMFLAYKSDLSEKMKASYVLYINTLLEIMGDKDIGLIEQGDVKNALLDYLRLPKRNLEKYKNKAVADLLEMEIDEEDKLAQKSVSQVKKLLQGIFTYAVETKYVASSVMNGLKMNFSSKVTFAKYEDVEILQILGEVNNNQHIARKWICWLAAYTGARRGEIIQLRKQDVKIDSKTKRHYLLITSDAGALKTENAFRRVPIHKALIDEGFLSYVESQEDKLFDGLNAESFTKWFFEFRESLGIERYNDFNHRKVFHSFRHSFITKSRGAGNEGTKVQQVIGHEKLHFGVTDRYTHDYDLYQVLDVIDKVSYTD